MPIPNGSTPIKHEILTDIFAKGLLTYDELRIISFLARWSWGFHENWTHKGFTVSEIAREINMNRGTCSKAINKMIKDGKLLRENNKFQFNEHYEKWGVEKSNSQKVLKKATESVENFNTPLLKKATPTVEKSNSQQPSNIDENKSQETRKDTLNILTTKKGKDTCTRILNFWNSLKIIEHKDTPKLRKKIMASLKIYTHEELEGAIKNYAYVLSNKDRFYWTYKWQLKDFLDRGIDRFLPQNFKESDYFKRVYKSKAELEEERSNAILAKIFQEEEAKEDDEKRNDSNSKDIEGSL